MAGQTLTTIAHIKGVDTFSGMLTRLAAKTSAVNTMLNRTATAARRMGYNMGGAQAGLFGAAAGGVAFLKGQYDLEDKLNRSRAILDLTTEQFKPLMREVERLGATYPLTMKDAAEASIEFGTAGLNASQQVAIFEQAVKGAMASGVSVAKVAGGVTDVIYGMGMAFDTSKEQARSFQIVNDTLAASAVSANQTYEGFLAGFRKAAPIFKVMGIEIKKGAAMLGALANAGIKAERAGTALRTMLVRPLKASAPMVAALDAVGLKLENYITKTDKLKLGDKTVTQFVKTNLGLDMSSSSGLRKILDDPKLKGSATEMANALTNYIVQETGQSGAENTQKVQKAMMDLVRIGFQRLDIEKLLKDMGEKNVSPAVYFELFGLRHIEKGMALADQLASGKYQQLLQKILDKTQIINGKGPVDRFMEVMLSGFPGAVKKINSAIDLFARKMGTSGALDEVVKVVDKLRAGVLSLSETSPHLMKWGTLALLAIGALAPLGFVIMGVTAALAPLVGALATVAPLLITGATNFIRWGGAIGGLVAKAAGLGVAARYLRVFGKVLGGLGLGLIISHWKELGALIGGFGSGLFGGSEVGHMDDIIGVALTPGERIASSLARLQGLFKPLTDMVAKLYNGLMELLGIDTSQSTVTQFFELGYAAASRLADVIETIVRGMEKISNFLGMSSEERAKLIEKNAQQMRQAIESGKGIDGGGGILGKEFWERKKRKLRGDRRVHPMSADELGATPGGAPVYNAARGARVDAKIGVDISGKIDGAHDLKIKATSDNPAVKAETPRNGNRTK